MVLKLIARMWPRLRRYSALNLHHGDPAVWTTCPTGMSFPLALIFTGAPISCSSVLNRSNVYLYHLCDFWSLSFSCCVPAVGCFFCWMGFGNIDREVRSCLPIKRRGSIFFIEKNIRSVITQCNRYSGYECSKCLFFIWTTSKITSLRLIFKVPLNSAMLNWIELKLFITIKSGRLITWQV